MKSVLDALGLKYGTDKASGGGHNYLHFYERFLWPLRDQKITVLEIGVGGGPSLRMWKEFFPLAQVIGMDIEPHKAQYAEDRIAIEIGDQSSKADLQRLIDTYGSFDLIVDDAGHREEDQMSCFNTMIPHVRLSGFYILEDISGNTRGFLTEVASKIINGESDLESIAFYKGTSVTKMRSHAVERW